MEDSVVVWGFIVIVIYGAAIRWFIKGLKAEKESYLLLLTVVALWLVIINMFFS